MLRENNFGPDVDWEARREAIREKMPGRFSNDDLQKRLEDVGKIKSWATFREIQFSLLHSLPPSVPPSLPSFLP